MSFSPLKEYPSPSAWVLDVHSDANNVMTGVEFTGTFVGAKGPREARVILPTVHTIFVISNKKSTKVFVALGPSGLYSYCTVLLDVYGYVRLLSEPAKVLTGFGFAPPLETKCQFSIGAIFDPLKVKDFAGLLKEQQLKREANVTRFDVLQKEIERLRAERLRLLSDKDAGKLQQLKTNVSTMYKLVKPDGKAVLTLDQISELSLIRPHTPSMVPVVNSLLGTSVTDPETALTELRNRFLELENARVVDPTSRASFMKSRWERLLSDHVPQTLFVNTISKEQLDHIRDRILAMNDDVRDFMSEIELVGFLTESLKFEQDKLAEIKERFAKPDTYQDLRAELTTRKLSLQAEIAGFRCDLTDLERQVRDAEKSRIKDEAAMEYAKNKGASTFFRPHRRCGSIR